MSGPFLCYREVIPPTSVDAARFFSHEGYGDFLITLTSAVINIYRVHPPVLNGVKGNVFSLLLHTKLFGRPYDVNVFSSNDITRRGIQRNDFGGYTYIMLNFDSGKVCISRFNPLKCSLDVVCLLNAEEEAIGAGSEVHALTQGRQISPAVGSTPYLAIDREDSIACTLLYGQQFFFMDLSFLTDQENVPLDSTSSVTQQNRSSTANPKKDSISQQFIVDIQLHLRLLGPILDYCFLPGYSRPTLAVLQECGTLPSGHAATVRNTCCISVLAVDKVTKSVSLLWRQLRLPHDSICLIPLSHPCLCGSIALISMNAVLLVDQETVIGTATCGFASTTVSSHIKLQRSKLSDGLELDASRWIEADNTTLVGSLKDGRLISIHFLFESESHLEEIKFEVALLASSIRSSCFCKSKTSDLWFLGSRLSDCLLVEAILQYTDYSSTSASSYPTDTKIDLLHYSGHTTPAVKRVRRASDGSYSSAMETPGSSSRAEHLANITAEEHDLYGDSLVLKQPDSSLESGPGSRAESAKKSMRLSSSSQLVSSSSSGINSPLQYVLRVVDSISVLGPVIDGTFCANEDTMDQMDRIEWNRVGMPLRKLSQNPASAYIVDREAKDSLHLYTGLDEQSGVHRITRGVRVSKLASRTFPGAISVQCLAASNAYSLLFVNFLDRSRVLQCTTTTSKTFENNEEPGSAVLSSDLSMKEISCSDAGFVSTAPTITAGLVHKNVSVQVVSTCVRVVNMSYENGLNGEALQDVFVADDIEMGGLGGLAGELIVCADVCQPWVALLTSTGSVYVLEFDGLDEMLVLKYSAKCSGSKRDGEMECDKSSENHVKDCSPANEGGDQMPSYNNVLTLNPITISLFHGRFPTSVKGSALNKQDFTEEYSSSSSSSVFTSDLCTTPAQTSKPSTGGPSPALSLLNPDEVVIKRKKERIANLLETQRYEEEMFLYGACIEEIGNNNSESFNGQYNLSVGDGDIKNIEMDVEVEVDVEAEVDVEEAFNSNGRDTKEGREMKEDINTNGNRKRNGSIGEKFSMKHRVDFIEGEGDEDMNKDIDGADATKRRASYVSYETPHKEKGKGMDCSNGVKNSSTNQMDMDEVDPIETKETEGMHLVLCDYNGVVKVMSLSTLNTVFETEDICLLPQTIKLSGSVSNHINNDAYDDKNDESSNTLNNLSERKDPSMTPVTPLTGLQVPRITTPSATTPLSRSNGGNQTSHTVRSQHRNVTDRVLIDARFAKIGREDSSDKLSKLCLIIVLESSDVVVYYLVEKGSDKSSDSLLGSKEHYSSVYHNEKRTIMKNNNKCISSANESYFVKLEHSVVTRKKRNRIRKRGSNLTNSNNSAEVISSNIKNINNINSIDKERTDDSILKDSLSSSLPLSLPSSLSSSSPYYRDENTDSNRIKISYDINGKANILVSGSRPIIIKNDSGLPFLAPIGLPELPFSNSGSYLLATLRIGDMKGIASLWVENDDIEGVQGPYGVNGGLNSLTIDMKKQSVLQLYQDVPNQIYYPGSVTSSKRLHSGLTTHHCIELLAKSEDNTEQALLKKKTFILSCSKEKQIPFLSTVLTNDEKEKEETFYDRFFPNLDSFCQPDVSIAPAPLISMREHKLVIMQSGTAVDEYVLPLGEQILGIEALYLNVTTTTIIPAIMNIGNTITMEKKIKRVFLVACTSVEDKHGEDTQGEGRIMLFGLDYALFQDAVVDTSDVKENDMTDHLEDPTSTSTSLPSTILPGILSQITSSIPVLTIPATKSKSQQSLEQSKFFKAIQPKLKLLWTGPGPASIVKQVGEFILSTVGTTVYIYRLNSETMELDQITFYFAQFFISSVSVMKNYILIADVCNSVQFLVWREEDLTLTLISKDMDSQTVLSTAFISDGTSLGIVVGDDESNIQLMKFDPRKIETKDGSRLLCMADFHLGSDATLLLSHSLLMAPALLQPPLPPMPPPMQPPLPPMPPPIPPHGTGTGMGMGSQVLGAPPLPPNPIPLSLSLVRVNKPKQSATSATGQPFGQRLDKLSSSKSCILIGTMDGGLGMLLPVEERMYRRLALLQQIMSMGVATPCGLNPRGYRLIKTTRFVTQKKKGVLDGSLLWKFVGLESSLQDELAAAMGITTDTILENLLELDLLGTFF